MSRQSTILDMAQALITLQEHTPLHKISVSDIVTASGKNRKTFYYHFSSKNELIHWIFRYHMAQCLRMHFEERELWFDYMQPEAFANLPYYATKKQGVRSLEGSGFVLALGQALQTYPHFYKEALTSTDPDGLYAYIVQLYEPALTSDIRFILSNRALQDGPIHFLSSFFIQGLLGYFTSQLQEPIHTDVLKDIGPFTNLIHSCIENEIKQQQLRRVL